MSGKQSMQPQPQPRTKWTFFFFEVCIKGSFIFIKKTLHREHFVHQIVCSSAHNDKTEASVYGTEMYILGPSVNQWQWNEKGKIRDTEWKNGTDY